MSPIGIIHAGYGMDSGYQATMQEDAWRMLRPHPCQDVCWLHRCRSWAVASCEAKEERRLCRTTQLVLILRQIGGPQLSSPNQQKSPPDVGGPLFVDRPGGLFYTFFCLPVSPNKRDVLMTPLPVELSIPPVCSHLFRSIHRNTPWFPSRHRGWMDLDDLLLSPVPPAYVSPSVFYSNHV